jgi:predicted transcriptional regulator
VTVQTYWFDLAVEGPVTDNHFEALGDVLTAGNGIDATPQADERGGIIMFTREAEDAVQAVTTAIRDAEAAGIRVTGVVADQVSVREIAERAGVTEAAVRYWIAGQRGPGGFPEPAVRRERLSLFSWAEVAAWLAWSKLGEADITAAELAQACKIIDAALIVRDGLRELPRHARPLVRELVA